MWPMMWQAMSAKPCPVVRTKGVFDVRVVAEGRRGGVAHLVAAQVDVESKVGKPSIRFQFQTLRSRRFQTGLYRVNLHRPTTWPHTAAAAFTSPNIQGTLTRSRTV
jgi:hypothetical protein